jgi:hypothetical protein
LCAVGSRGSDCDLISRRTFGHYVGVQQQYMQKAIRRCHPKKKRDDQGRQLVQAGNS